MRALICVTDTYYYKAYVAGQWDAELSRKEAQRAQKRLLVFVPFVNLRSVNTEPGDRILVPVRYPDALSIKDNGLGLKTHLNHVEQRAVAGK
jgi:hypothetical protein